MTSPEGQRDKTNGIRYLWAGAVQKRLAVEASDERERKSALVYTDIYPGT